MVTEVVHNGVDAYLCTPMKKYQLVQTIEKITSDLEAEKIKWGRLLFPIVGGHLSHLLLCGSVVDGVHLSHVSDEVGSFLGGNVEIVHSSISFLIPQSFNACCSSWT
mgnify:CR=1 FL=1